MAGWEDRFMEHMEAIEKLVNEAKKAVPAAAQELQDNLDMLDQHSALQQTFVDIDEGAFDEDSDDE